MEVRHSSSPLYVSDDDAKAATRKRPRRLQSNLPCGPSSAVLGNAPFRLKANNGLVWSFASDGRLSRSSAVCRRDCGFHAIVSGAHKCSKPCRRVSFCPVSRPLWKRLSGDYYLDKRECCAVRSEGGPTASTARRHPAAPFCCDRPRSLPPLPGPGCGFLLLFVFPQGCNMGRPDRILSWWDQEVDSNGRCW